MDAARKIKVLCGTPLYKNLEGKCYISLTGFLNTMVLSPRFLCFTAAVEGVYVDKNRDAIAQLAIDGNYDYLFFIDSDMVFPTNILDVLYDKHKDVIVAVYCIRSGDSHGPCVFHYDEKEGNFHRYLDWSPDETYKVDGVGMGMTLISVSALKKISPPRFAYCNAPDVNGKKTRFGEDLSFCLRCKEAGIDVYADSHATTVGHVIEKVWTIKDYHLRIGRKER